MLPLRRVIATDENPNVAATLWMRMRAWLVQAVPSSRTKPRVLLTAIALGVFLTRLSWPSYDPSTVLVPAERTAAVEIAAIEAPTTSPAPASDPIRSLCAKFNTASQWGPAAKGEHDELLGQMRGLLAASNPAEIVRSLRPGELTTPLGTTALEAWLATDCMAASTWIAKRPNATESHAWLVAHALTQQPEVLGEFCNTLGADQWAQTFLDHASREILRKTPPAAVLLAESLPAGERRTRLLETIAFDWMNRDPSAARAWINEVPDSLLRQRLVAVGAESHASAAPLQALEWLLDQSPSEHLPEESIETIVGIWRQTAPAEMTAWSSRFTPFDPTPRQSLLR